MGNPTKIELEEGKEINKINAGDHVKLSNETMKAFNKAKDGSRKFIDKVFHRNNTNNVQISPLEIRDRYVDYIFMGMIFLGMMVILVILRPVKKIMRTRQGRTKMTNLSDTDHELQCVQVEGESGWD